MKIQSIAFFCYPVSDMAKAREFYEGLLGLKMTHNFNDQFVEYDLGDTTFSIGTGAPMMKPGAPGGCISFEVDEIEKWVATMKGFGIPFALELYETPVCRMFIVTDPDQNHVMIHQRKVSATPVSDAVKKG